MSNLIESDLHIYKLREWISSDHLYWDGLSSNTHPAAIEMLKSRLDMIGHKFLSANVHPWAMQYTASVPNKIYWDWLSANSSPYAIKLLKQNPDKVSWEFL